MKKSFLRRFIFDKLPVRGACVDLTDVWQTISAQKEYPDGVKQVLGELMAANVLMTANIKFEGKIITQIQGNPKFDLVVSECDNELGVRSTAKYEHSVHEDNQVSYLDCMARGSMVISIDSEKDGKLYQSVVALTKLDLGDVLTEYMLQSEQLRAFFVLAYSSSRL